MKVARWIIFLPVAAVVSFVAAALTRPGASYHGFSAPYLLATLLGIAPMVFQNVAVMVLFIAMATWIAPSSKKGVAVACVLIGALFTLPIPEWEIDLVFPLIGWCSRVTGAILGLLLVFYLLKKKKTPNQPPEPTSGLAPGRGSS